MLVWYEVYDTMEGAITREKAINDQVMETVLEDGVN